MYKEYFTPTDLWRILKSLEVIQLFLQMKYRMFGQAVSMMTAFDPPFERLFYEDFNGGFRFKGGGKYLPRYFNLLHSKVGNVNINRTALAFFVFDPVDAMYATAYLFLVKAVL